MNSNAQFPQADNLELVYKVFVDMTADGLNRYSFSEKYSLSDRQGAYYLNAICFIGLAEKTGKNTYLSTRGKAVQALDEPFRKKCSSWRSSRINSFVMHTTHVKEKIRLSKKR